MCSDFWLRDISLLHLLQIMATASILCIEVWNCKVVEQNPGYTTPCILMAHSMVYQGGSRQILKKTRYTKFNRQAHSSVQQWTFWTQPQIFW
jgi:hypothetical protein